jgi:DNA polymerase sigma
MNINDRLGISNTMLLKHYVDLYDPLRQAIKVLKQWTKSLDLNCPAGTLGQPTSFSSYALALMTIGLFQASQYVGSVGFSDSSVHYS